MSRLIGAKEIENIATGAAVLGAGGGGDPYIGKLMAAQAVKKYGPISLIPAESLPDDAFILPIAVMGAPSIIIEKIISENQVLEAFDIAEKFFGKKASAVMSLEAGGVNSLIPITVAAMRKIPMIDGDTMGRAFPELQMTTFSLNGINSSPVILADEKGNSTVITSVSNKWSERLARPLVMEMGGAVIIVFYSVNGAQLKKHAVLGTITKCEKIGHAIHESKKISESPLQAMLKETSGFELFKGKIMDVERNTDGGFTRGKTLFEGIYEYKEKKMTIDFQNENIVAYIDKKVVASVPDLIVCLDLETALPITVEGYKYGARCCVVAIGCSDVWRSSKGISTVGPKYFGYDIDYVPIEECLKHDK